MPRQETSVCVGGGEIAHGRSIFVLNWFDQGWPGVTNKWSISFIYHVMTDIRNTWLPFLVYIMLPFILLLRWLKWFILHIRFQSFVCFYNCFFFPRQVWDDQIYDHWGIALQTDGFPVTNLYFIIKKRNFFYFTSFEAQN